MLPNVAALLFVNARTSSPLWKLPVIATVAEANVGAPPSLNVKPESIATGVDAVLSPATNAAQPESVAIVGGPSKSTVCVAAALSVVPSLVTKEIVWLPGVALALDENVTARSADVHCASVAVAPDEVNVSTP
ncbi:hypothetical protein BTA35_0217215, partial [Oceanospirillum linum]